ncbi:hypothetical protein BRC87_02035 [Halobacteriales archaeon QS_4_66_20]|nr:MAG: hypothetical protein BRC87_02035 [Halobacteriales archaeon QS_4_66_20]
MRHGRQIGGVVLTAIMVLSMVAMGFAPTAGATADGPTAHDELAGDRGPNAALADRDRVGDAPANGAVLTGAQPANDDPPGHGNDRPADANGTVSVVARVEAVELDDRPGARSLPENASDRARERMKEVAEQSQKPVVDHARATPGVEVTERFWLANAVLLEVDTERADLDALAEVENVTRLHENFEVEIPEPVENGTGTETAGSTATAGEYDTTWGLDRANATEVWSEYGTRGEGVKVAVLDTGVRVDHPDIDLFTEDPDDPTYPGGWAEFDADGKRVEGSEPYDSGTFIGHGTHVSGTVVGGNASGEYIGMAPDADLMHALALSRGTGTFAQIIASMQWAVDNDADVISMSLGAPGTYPSFIEPVRNAEDAGVAVVAAEGNDRDRTGTPGAVYDSLTIGASDEGDGLPSFSGGTEIDTQEAWYPFAPEEWPDEYIVPDIVAPGDDIKSAIGRLGDYRKVSGSSMATPHVSGTIALALSAADNESVDQLKNAVTSSVWKPADCDEEFEGGYPPVEGECAPDGKDPGYGWGILDAKGAVDRVAANSGFTGTVTGPDGEPVTDGTAELDGFNVELDEDGSYTLRETEGEYEVTADGFGYEPETATGTVNESEFTELDFTLEETLAVEPVSSPAEAILPDNETAMTVRTANVESWTVEQVGDFEGDATLFVDGEAVAFGETVEFDDYTGPVEISVHVAEGDGNVKLEHTVTGAGETATVTTPSTLVTDRFVDVGVVGAYKFGYAGNVQLVLDTELPANYRFEYVSSEDLLDVTDEYDVFVVQNFGSGEELAGDFHEATSDPGTGVVYLDQQPQLLFTRPDTSNAITQLSRATNDPKRTKSDKTFATDFLQYSVDRAHPILDGVAEPGENVTIQERDRRIEYTTFEEFSGQTLAGVNLPEGGYTIDAGVKGPGLAIDEKTRTVLAASMGRYFKAENDQFTDAADDVLVNSVQYLGQEPQATLERAPPDRVDPDESVEATFEVSDLESLSVAVAERSTLSADELTLSVDGETVGFDETVEFDERDGEVTVAVEADEAGAVALKTTVETAGAEHPLTVLTGTTAVYEPPLVVGEDVDGLDEANAMLLPGATVHVANGTYKGQLIVDQPGVTLAAAPGADPVLEPGKDAKQWEAVLRIEQPGVTVDGLTIDHEAEELADRGSNIGDYYGIELRGNTRETTIRDVEIYEAGTGIALANSNFREGLFVDARDTTITGVTVADGPVGMVVGETGFFGGYGTYDGLEVSDTEFRNLKPAGEGFFTTDATGIDHVWGTGVTYTNVTVEGCEGDEGFFAPECDGGFVGGFAWNTTLENSTFNDSQAGIVINNGVRQFEVRNNDVLNSGTGIEILGAIRVQDFNTARVTENHVEAETGLRVVDKTDPTVEVRYNDFSASDTVFEKDTISYFGDPPEFDPDLRLNYFGERGPDPAAVNRYDPFLTAPPADVATDADETTELATHLELAANETQAVGIPGPTDQTVAEILGSAFEGTVEMYDKQRGDWEPVDVGSGVQLDPLDVLRVTPEENTTLVANFQAESGKNPPAGPGKPPISLDRGQNVVAAPLYDEPDAAFATPSDAVTLEKQVAIQPTGQLGPDAAEDEVSPFAGYVVDAQRPVPLEFRLSANPTVYELHEQLGLERPSLTGTDTNLTEASYLPEKIVQTTDATERVAALEQGRMDHETVEHLVNATLDAAADEAAETDDPVAIWEAVNETLHEEADELGIRLGERDIERIIEIARQACHGHQASAHLEVDQGNCEWVHAGA